MEGLALSGVLNCEETRIVVNYTKKKVAKYKDFGISLTIAIYWFGDNVESISENDIEKYKDYAFMNFDAIKNVGFQKDK